MNPVVTDSTAIGETITLEVFEQGLNPTDTTAVSDWPQIGIPTFFQSAPTLAGISQRDVVHYGRNQSGSPVGVLSVGTPTISSGDVISVTVVLTDGTVCAMSTANTILKSFRVDSNGIAHASWVFSQ
jgi:hypothetical protein